MIQQLLHLNYKKITSFSLYLGLLLNENHIFYLMLVMRIWYYIKTDVSLRALIYLFSHFLCRKCSFIALGQSGEQVPFLANRLRSTRYYPITKQREHSRVLRKLSRQHSAMRIRHVA